MYCTGWFAERGSHPRIRRRGHVPPARFPAQLDRPHSPWRYQSPRTCCSDAQGATVNVIINQLIIIYIINIFIIIITNIVVIININYY